MLQNEIEELDIGDLTSLRDKVDRQYEIHTKLRKVAKIMPPWIG